MKFDVITIFPEMIEDYKKVSIIARAISKKLINIKAVNLRDFTEDPHQTVDDRPYGGGVGMVIKPDIMSKAIKKVSGKKSPKKKVILLTPQGKVFNQAHAKRLAKMEHLIFVSGRYEGFDERIRDMVDEEFSIGDYVLMGGELPALVMIETVSRFLKGVVGKEESTKAESFAYSFDKYKKLLEYPQYTRPEKIKHEKKTLVVPKILLSGNHEMIEEWRRNQALKRTQKRRPDFFSHL